VVAHREGRYAATKSRGPRGSAPRSQSSQSETIGSKNREASLHEAVISSGTLTALWRREVTVLMIEVALVACVGLAALIAAVVAYGQPRQHAAPHAAVTPRRSKISDPIGAPPCKPTTSWPAGSQAIARVPDPFIRGKLVRHHDDGWPD
jgi:hypothetical protein